MGVGRTAAGKSGDAGTGAQGPLAPLAGRGERARVLVLACDPSRVTDVLATLEASGYPVVDVCAPTDEALLEAGSRQAQVAVAEFDLRHRDAAFDFADRLRDRLGIPTVFVTECADDETLARARALQPVGYVLRPLNDSALRVAIELGLDRRALERRLVHRQAFLEAMFEWAGVGIAVLDDQGAVLQTNRTLDSLLDLPHKGRIRLESLSHPDVAPRERRLFRQLVAGKRPHYRLECRYLRSNEESGVGYVTATRLDGPERGRVVRVMTDISYARLEKIASFQENERHLISSELHDAVSQPMAGVFYRLQATQQILAADPTRAQLELSCSLQVVQSLLEELSRLIYNLRAPSLDGGNLVEALERLAADFRRETSTGLVMELPARLPALGRLQALFIYRILQESLVNVRRHAAASQASVTLRLHGGCVEGRVDDDGKAPPAGYERSDDSRRHHFGLRAMRERAELLGGRLHVRARPEGGTTVSFELPLRGGASDD